MLQAGEARVDGDVVGRAAGAVVPGLALRREGHGRFQLAARASLDSAIVSVGGGAGLGLVVDDGVDVGAGRATLDDHWLPSGRLELGVDVGAAHGSVSLRHASRAPTLDERFAPAGFITANPGLRAERTTAVEVRGGVAIAAGPRPLAVDVAAFASSLDDAIVLVNRNAFEVAPENTGPARRAGLELGLRARPLALLVVEQAATLLWSHVEATGAPLPTAPPLALRSTARVGADDAWVSCTVTGRGSAPSTIFGTLGSGAFVLVDLGARLPLGDRVALTLAVDNALDVRHARDQNLLPLPGRLAAVGLEVRP
jgi:outer membrane receptor protein involved in Fe transport